MVPCDKVGSSTTETLRLGQRTSFIGSGDATCGELLKSESLRLFPHSFSLKIEKYGVLISG